MSLGLRIQHMLPYQSIKQISAILLVTFGISGCAKPASVKPMTSSSRANALSPADINLSGAICVKTVDGGKTTNPLWVSEVDNASFLIALEASLKNNGLLAETPETCRYDVEVNLLGLSQPYISIDVEVTANVNYRVRKAGIDEPYLLKTIQTSYTARFTQDKLLWGTRLKEANEGSIRKNIGEFIDAILTRPPSS